jgi:hypothetical protein
MSQMGVPNRGTSEMTLDQFNVAMRSSPLYQNFMTSRGLRTDGHVKLSDRQQADLERELARNGIPVPKGMHIDQGGNLNQKNRLLRNVGIGAAVTAAALTGFGLAGIGPLAGALGGGGATLGGTATGLAASGTGSVGAAAAPVVGTTAGLGGWSAPLFGTAANYAGGGAFLGAGAGSAAATGAAAGAGWGAVNSVAPAAGKFLTGSNMLELGKMGAGGITSYLQNRSTQNALRDTNAATMADNAAQRDFLREQYDREHQDYLDAIAEQKRQWDEEQKEKARQWEAMEPWREAGRGNLTRMNSLLDEPRPGRVAYQPTFQYRP